MNITEKQMFLDLIEIPREQRFLKCCTKIQEKHVAVDLMIEISRRQRALLELLHAKSQKKKTVFFDLMIEIPRKQRGFELLHEYPRKQKKRNSQKTKGFLMYCMKISEEQWSPKSWPGIYRITAYSVQQSPKSWNYSMFSALGSQTLEFTASSVQQKTTSRNLPHYQRYFQGTDAHESKPSEEGPSPLFSSVTKVTVWEFFPVTGCWLWSHNKQIELELIPPK